MKTKTSLFMIAFVIALSIHSQNTWIVNNNPGSDADFIDIQSAINTSVAGDTLYIQQSEINYNDAILNKQINLVGRSHSESSYRSSLDILTIEASASGSFISGLWIDRIDTANSATITDVVIQNNFIDNFEVSNSSVFYNSFVVGNIINAFPDIRMNNSVISHNVFTNSSILFNNYDVTFKNNIIVINPSAASTGLNNATYSTANPNNITVENCILIKPSGANNVTSFSTGNDGFVFENCISYSADGAFVTLPFEGVDTNLNDIDPQFVSVTTAIFNAYTEDYHLQAGSPAINFGNDGQDIGVYNNGFSFNNFGFTNGIPRVTITAITNTVAPGADIEVTIQGNSN